jgi:hypothetical protein
MNAFDLVTSGALSSLLLEGVKFMFRKWIVKDDTYQFPAYFYTISLPLLNAVMPFVLVALGLQSADPILTMDVVGVVRYLVLVLLSSLISLTTNTVGLSPLKNYAFTRKQGLDN